MSTWWRRLSLGHPDGEASHLTGRSPDCEKPGERSVYEDTGVPVEPGPLRIGRRGDHDKSLNRRPSGTRRPSRRSSGSPGSITPTVVVTRIRRKIFIIVQDELIRLADDDHVTVEEYDEIAWR